MNAVETALYTKLSGGTALTGLLGGTAIYNAVVTQGTALPYAVFFESSGGDDNSSPRRARSLLYTAKGVAERAYTANAIDEAMDALLHEGALSITGWNDYWVMRETDVAYEEKLANGNVVYHRGGQYRIRISE